MKLYNSILLNDLEGRMGENYKSFDYKVRRQGAIEQDPGTQNKIFDNLVENLYEEMNEPWIFGGFGTKDLYFDQLNQMNDKICKKSRQIVSIFQD